MEAASLSESLAGHAFLKESRSSLEQRASEGLMQTQGPSGPNAVEGLHSLLIRDLPWSGAAKAKMPSSQAGDFSSISAP